MSEKDSMEVKFYANGIWATVPHGGSIGIETETGEYVISYEDGRLNIKSVHCAMEIYPLNTHAIAVIDAHHKQWRKAAK